MKKFTLEPLHNFCTVEPIVQEEKILDSGLVVAQKEKPRPQLATVIAVGPGARALMTGERMSMDVKPGDVVAITQYSSIRVEFADSTYTHIIGELDILGKVVCEDVEDD
jgi:chaperonin GroES